MSQKLKKRLGNLRLKGIKSRKRLLNLWRCSPKRKKRLQMIQWWWMNTKSKFWLCKINWFKSRISQSLGSLINSIKVFCLQIISMLPGLSLLWWWLLLCIIQVNSLWHLSPTIDKHHILICKTKLTPNSTSNSST